VTPLFHCAHHIPASAGAWKTVGVAARHVVPGRERRRGVPGNDGNAREEEKIGGRTSVAVIFTRNLLSTSGRMTGDVSARICACRKGAAKE